jgi:hypothetical protein
MHKAHVVKGYVRGGQGHGTALWQGRELTADSVVMASWSFLWDISSKKALFSIHFFKGMVPRNVMWWALQKHKVSSKYITLIKDMYDNVVTSVRTNDGDINDFSINIVLHQGSALGPYLFALVMTEVTRDIQGGIPWCMLFTNDVILVDESRTGVDQKELWRWTLDAKDFRLSRSKTEYMKCDFSATTQEEGVLDSMVRWYPKKTHFTTWDWCSKRMGISMKMLVIELKSAG